MPINITDEFHAATTKGKIASAKEVFLTGDTENLQQIGEKTHQLEDYIKNIAITGGASTAAAVTFDNTASGMAAVTAQAAIDELSSKISEESTRVDGELEKKFAKADIVQEPGNSEELVMSQKAVSDKLKELSTKQEIIYDVSARNDSAVFESLQALLSSPNLDTLIPMSFRHGGMSISFIQSSDNKYVQYRLTSDTFDITVANWERYNDVTASNQSFSDLDISDEECNVIARFSGGEFQTKNFDTTNTPSQDEDNSTAEFQISDQEGNVIAEFQGGHFRTKEFNSRNVSGAEVVKDIQGRNILLFK